MFFQINVCKNACIMPRVVLFPFTDKTNGQNKSKVFVLSLWMALNLDSDLFNSSKKHKKNYFYAEVALCNFQGYIFVFEEIDCTHCVMENGENQHTFIRRSEIAFPSERHSVVK